MKDVEVKPVVITHGEGIRNVRMRKVEMEDKEREGEKL